MKKILFVLMLFILLFFVGCKNVNDNNDGEEKNGNNYILEIPKYNDLGYLNREVFEGIITTRVPEKFESFPEKILRSFTSGQDQWLGIEMTLILPSFTQHESETYPVIGFTATKNKFNIVGLKGESGENFVYKIIWNHKDFENSNSKYIQVLNNVDTQDFLYFAGDKVRLSLYSLNHNSLQLSIELLEPSNMVDDKITRNSEVFTSPEIIIEDNFVKEVIYQRLIGFENEQKKPNEIKSTINNAVIESSYLYRLINNDVYKWRFNYERAFVENLYENIYNFNLSYNTTIRSNGGEEITLMPRKS